MSQNRNDNSLRRAKNLSLGERPISLRDQVGPRDRVDYFRVQSRRSSTAQISLRGNNLYRASLLNQNGRVIRQFRGSGLGTIQQTLQPGTYFLRLEAGSRTRNTRYTLSASLAPLPALTLPTVSLETIDGIAQETQTTQTANPGAFRLTRSGSTNESLSVTYVLSGTATNGADYSTLTGSAVIPAGQASTTIPITVVDDLLVEGSETLTLTLRPNSSYTLGATTGTVTLNDNDRPFNIQFDYRFDTNGWFTPERRAVLEAAADIWEGIIQDEFADIPAGSKNLVITNPQTGFQERFFNNFAIDDLVIFVGARELTGISQPSRSGFPAGESRYEGPDFEPWAGSIAFDLDSGSTPTNWFFDPTPNRFGDSELSRTGGIDFFSVAQSEIARILGISTSTAFDNFVIRDASNNPLFNGENARLRNGGNPIPLSPSGTFIRDGYTFGNSGLTLLDETLVRGQRFLPTVLDLAILDDIGYTVDYSQAATNPAPLG